MLVLTSKVKEPCEETQEIMSTQTISITNINFTAQAAPLEKFVANMEQL